MWRDETAKMVPCQDGHTGKQNEMDITGGRKGIERHKETERKCTGRHK